MKISIQPKKKTNEAQSELPTDQAKELPDVASRPKISKKEPVAAPEVSIMSSKTIEDTYQSKELRQHIYDSPDTYAGSINPSTEKMWVFDPVGKKMEKKMITFIEAFHKIFDEVLVNATDQERRIHEKLAENQECGLRPVRNIKVILDRETGWITIENDGEGIEIVKHKEKNIFIPEMLFGELLTSINYDKTQRRTVGGKNGYGAKITNILSKEFIIETVDAHRKMKFVQTYRNNMTERSLPEITSVPSKTLPYTRVKYLPDYSRFGITDFKTIDDWDLLARRVYDTSACTDKACSTYLNGEKIAVKTFEDYVNLYIGGKRDTKRVYYSPNDRWEVVVCMSTGDFDQISFVNGIFTDRGGKHVSHVIDGLTKKLADSIESKNKKVGDIKPSIVKRYLWVFVKSTIENPSFDTQTKRCMTSLVSDFGSRCESTDPKDNEEFVTQVLKLGIADKIAQFAEFKAKQALGKKTDGKKTRRVFNPKLTDASVAGTAQSKRAILVLTEGDSAATFFSAGIKGLTQEERKYWGCFPLKGKPLNVKTGTISQLEKNEEIANIKKIVGLVEGQDYSGDNISKLRYGKIMILSDADKDGDHIKGLLMNFIHTYWPSLIERGDFVASFATPILKVWPERLGENPDVTDMISFFSEKAYHEWAETHPTKWMHKYYKGLGSHTAPEACDCFKHMAITNYSWGSDTSDFNGTQVNSSKLAIELAFSKKFEDNRKQWILDYDATPQEEQPYDIPHETIANFINKRMILFSKADVVRSVPCVFDGFKPSQRKAVFAYMQGKHKKQIKVSALVGDMNSKAEYHHGEASACGTIVGLATDFVGSGNLSILYPSGNFGSRKKNGDDVPEPRYIFVGQTPYLEILFNDHDQKLLEYHIDDGVQVEPTWYLPVIPLVLINGAEGIGTGWSTTVPCYNPHDVVDNLKRKINGEAMQRMIPWYRGYNGSIVETGEGKYVSLGDWFRSGPNQIRITELPVGCKNCKSFEKYKEFIFSLADPDPKGKKDDDAKSARSGFGDTQVIEDVDIAEETDTKMVIDITFKDGFLDTELQANENFKFEKKLKIAVSFSTTNMHLMHGTTIKKYWSPLDIIDDYYPVRLGHYHKRKEYILNDLRHKLAMNNAKYRFVLEVITDKIVLHKKTKSQIIDILAGTAPTGAADPPFPVFTSKSDGEQEKANYEYLLSMRMDSTSQEKLEELKKAIEKLEAQIADLEARTPESLWLDELNQFIKIYDEDTSKWRTRNKLDQKVVRKSVAITKTKTKVSITKRSDSDTSSLMTHLEDDLPTPASDPDPVPVPVPTAVKITLKKK